MERYDATRYRILGFNTRRKRSTVTPSLRVAVAASPIECIQRTLSPHVDEASSLSEVGIGHLSWQRGFQPLSHVVHVYRERNKILMILA